LNRKVNRKYSATFLIENNRVIAEDNAGNIIEEGRAGVDDARVLQSAIDYIHPGGEVKMLRGKYIFAEPVVVYNTTMINGEGRGTIITPPSGDYAFKVITTEKSPLRSEINGLDVDNSLYGVVFRDFAIDGERKGKGIYMKKLIDSFFEGLWIVNTDGVGLNIDEYVWECNFENIHLMGNGNADMKEATIMIGGGDNNNLRFERTEVLFPNYRGVEIGAGNRPYPPRLIFFSHSMFHGVLPIKKAPQYELIYVNNVDSKRGAVISDSRITHTGERSALIKVMRGSVTISNCIIGGGTGMYAIRGEKGAMLRIVGNTFHDGPNNNNEYSLYATGSEVIFQANILDGKETKICLAPASNSIIANNRFILDTEECSIWIGDDNCVGSSNIEISGNIFSERRAEAAIKVSSLSTENIKIHDNQYFGSFSC